MTAPMACGVTLTPSWKPLASTTQLVSMMTHVLSSPSPRGMMSGGGLAVIGCLAWCWKDALHEQDAPEIAKDFAYNLTKKAYLFN